MKKILVVDDHPMMLNLMSNMLTREGHHVVTAEDGFTALDKLSVFIPDIMFVDLIMPGLSGGRLCRIVRNMPHMDQCYVVVVSGVVAEQELDYAVMGADAYIAKGPFSSMEKHILTVIDASGCQKKGAGQEPVKHLNGACSRRITKELLTRNRHLETILESMAEAILETSAGRIVYANSAAIALFDVPEEKLLGSYPEDLFDENVREEVKAMSDSAPGMPSQIGEDRSVFLNNRQVTIKKLPMKGTPSAGIILVTDITERKRIEMLEFANNLALRLMDELRNPLVAVGGLAARISHGDYPSDKLKEYTSLIFQESNKLDNALDKALAHLKAAAEGR